MDNNTKILLAAILGVVGYLAWREYQKTRPLMLPASISAGELPVDLDMPVGAQIMPDISTIAGMGSYQYPGCMN